jgi:hypothetical protein
LPTTDLEEDENGWAFSCGDLGNLMLKKKPDFDSRNYGLQKCSLIKSMNKFEIDERKMEKQINYIYVRRK